LLVPMQAAAVTVSLSVNPSRPAAGTAVTLTANVTPTPPPPPPSRPLMGALRQPKPVYTYAYTYTAQRTSPCQETIAIAGSGPSTTWTPAPNKAGSYILKVAVVEKMRIGKYAPSEA